MTLVVGTAGHIDHGKTTLLRALTGTDPDRLPEERRRGMTIDVGYAHATLDDGGTIDFVDVPGHDRLIGNMLVGAGEIDAALVVVAADDGPRPQTTEHLELLDALGIAVGVAAVTKIDVATPSRVADVRAEMRALLDRTSLSGAPVLAVSGSSGEGLDELRGALQRLLGPREATRPPRLAIDRVFTARGRGVVVTGTLRGGQIRTGDTLQAIPGERPVRIREVQVHGTTVETAMSGRVALNLAGPGAAQLQRGDVLAAPGVLTASDRLLVALRPPARLMLRSGESVLPADRARLRLHLGTDQLDARLGRAGREAVSLDAGRATAILRLDRPVAVAAGDRFVLRRPSPGATAAGGVVLDVDPPRGVSRRRATGERLAAFDAAVAAGNPPPARLALHGAIAAGPRVELAVDVRDEVQARLLGAVGAAGGAMSLGAARSAAALGLRRLVTLDAAAATHAVSALVDELLSDGSLERDGDSVSLPGRAPAGPSPAEVAAMDRLVVLLDQPAPPGLGQAARASGCTPQAVRALERTGRIVTVADDLAWSSDAWRRLVATALGHARVAPLTPAALRDATGTSRKYVMALLEDLNRRGVLVRDVAGHRPGPRADTVLDGSPVA